MFIGNLTPEEAMEEMRNGSYQEGFKEGLKIGYEQGLREVREEFITSVVEMGLLSAAEALELFGVQVDESALGKSEE